MGMNYVFLSGYVGTEPNIVVGKSNFKVARLSIGTTTYRNKQQVTDWHNVEAFGTAASYIEKYVKKGDYVVVTGFLSTKVYKGKDGTDKHAYNVTVSSIEKPRVKDHVESETKYEPGNNTNKSEDDMPY